MAGKVAQVLTADKEFNRFQTQLAKTLGPALANPLNDSALLKSVSLAIGSNSVPHKLGRTLIGWIIVRQRAASAIYDTQDANSTPDQTLLLTSSAAVTCDILVF